MAKVQARVRGSMVRGAAERNRMEKASRVLQTSYRAHSRRDAEEEHRRKTWMQ